MPAPVVSHHQNHDVAPHFNYLHIGNAVVLLTILLASGDTNTRFQWCQWPKSNVAPDFKCVDLRDAMVSFLIPLAPCDANTSANVSPHFDYLDLTNASMKPLASHDANAIPMAWPKKSHYFSFWSYLPKKCNDAIDDTVSIVWHWYQHQWHYIT